MLDLNINMPKFDAKFSFERNEKFYYEWYLYLRYSNCLDSMNGLTLLNIT